MMDDEMKAFTKAFESNMEAFVLPDKLQAQYKIIDCLKDCECKNIYLITDFNGTRYLLKEYCQEYSFLAKNEYDIFIYLKAIPNLYIPKVIDYFVENNQAYLLREYIIGDSLLSMYENNFFHSDLSIITTSIKLCSAISKFHEQEPPIIHRDIKPENFILERKTGNLYLIDFDSARFYKEGQERDTLFLGTPTHAAPESYGYAQCDVRSDIFGLGKTILYLCCGRSDDSAIIECEIPNDLKKIIGKCIAFSPKDRYSNVHCVQKHLEKIYTYRYRSSTMFLRIKQSVLFSGIILVAFALGILFDHTLLTRGNMVEKPENSPIAESEKQLEINSSNEALPKADTNVSATSKADTDKVANTDSAIEPDTQSIESKTQRIAIDVSPYQDLVDEIITSYYEMNMEDMGKAYDELFTMLYSAEDLQQFEWTDITKLDVRPDNYDFRPYPNRLCDPMACYDRILYSKIGNFQYYSGSIYNMMDFWLNEETCNDNEFYLYATQDHSNEYGLYREALLQVVHCAIRGVMDADKLEFFSP